MSDLSSHPLLQGLEFGKEIYSIEIHGNGKGEYVGITREDDGPCCIVFRGSLVTENGRKLIRARGTQAWASDKQKDDTK
ncbi:hypothetical protein [Komagataeibacter swingsii]|uniref:Uncharacterized protein n=1 Tax=Komagataeibacter swingsii TaxID=215220 RepID=A0A2V4RBB9_9PROT|nr:hypothetical protein [Komagataeibacter swingsii]PYD69420.1 hypothetical protein CFR76_10110 [Komagataeibacter swingsii]GBQ65725.1 hypothetical protein AA16373_3144 [Komagataeibacter swingsii DSM 16373]